MATKDPELGVERTASAVRLSATNELHLLVPVRYK